MKWCWETYIPRAPDSLCKDGTRRTFPSPSAVCQGNGGIGTGTPKYHAVAAASTPTTGAAATKPPYLDKPGQ